MSGVYETLQERGFIHQVTDEAISRLCAERKITLYCGFDPTARSLHLGNLVPVMALLHFQRAGHRPIVVVGGATGLVGDPSGKGEERPLLAPETLAENVAGIRGTLARFLSFEGEDAALLLNNYDWTGSVGYLDFLREVGKHFTVNYMMAKESVRARLEDREQGISYTEFSYMLLQAYDFLHLHDAYGCLLQVGGSDQWGNITAGVDLIRKKRQKTAYGITFPLLETTGGEKFGKSAGNALWLSAEMTPTWDFYQYFVRTSDADVGRFLKLFTFLPLAEIADLERQVAEHPEARQAQRRLAGEATRLVHGAAAARQMERAAEAVYGGEIAELDDELLSTIFADAPSSKIARDRLARGVLLSDLLVETGLCRSKGEARRLAAQGGAYVNNRRAETEARLDLGNLASPSLVVLRSGKKNYHLLRVV